MANPGRAHQSVELRAAFNLFDKDGDGRITSSELHEVLSALHPAGTSSQHVDRMIAAVDFDRNGTIEFEEFERVMSGRELVEVKSGEHWKEVFDMFDTDRNGMISPEELKEMMERFGQATTMDEARAMLRGADLNGDGQLDFHEFKAMLEVQ